MQSSTTPDPGYQWEVTSSQLDTTDESQEVSPFPWLMEFHTVYQLERSISVLRDVGCYFSFLFK